MMVSSFGSRSSAPVPLVLALLLLATTWSPSLLLIRPVDAKSPIAFRLDDIQCGYLESQQKAIMSAFARNNVPLTIGVLTGEFMRSGGAARCSWLADYVSSSIVEVASHSMNHVDLTGLTPNAALDYSVEIADSRTWLRSTFPTKDISLFIPPFNSWNSSVPQYVAAAGYTSISVLCSYDVVQPYGSGTPDNICTSNMYPGVTEPYFQKLGDLYHVPIGSSTATTSSLNLVSDPATVLTGATSLCGGSDPICSIPSQIAAMTDGMLGSAVPYAVVMMHAQDFLLPTALSDAEIGTWMDSLLTQAKTLYDIYTVSGLLQFQLNGATSSSTGTSSETAASSSSAGTDTMPSSSAASLPSSSAMEMSSAGVAASSSAMASSGAAASSAMAASSSGAASWSSGGSSAATSSTSSSTGQSSTSGASSRHASSATTLLLAALAATVALMQ